MIIVLDTCILYQDLYWKGTSFCLLEDFLKKTTSNLCIPTIVYDEIVNKYNEKYIESLHKLKLAYSEMKSLYPDNTQLNLPIDFDDKAIDNYKKFLTNKLRTFNCIMADYPEVSHKEIVARALSRKKPFDSKGKEGYRDFLIWTTLLNIAKTNPGEQIVFISSNTKDFSDGNNKDSLDDVLLSDLDTNNIEKSKIKYYCSVNKFISMEVTPLLEKYDKIKNSNIISEFIGVFNQQICSNVKEKLINQNLDEINLEIDAEYINVKMWSAEDFDDIEIEEIFVIDENRLLVNGKIGFFCNLSFEVLKTDVLKMKKIRFDIDFSKNYYNKEYLIASTTLWIKVDFEVVFSLSDKQINSIRLKYIRNGNDDCLLCDDNYYDDDDDEIDAKNVLKYLIEDDLDQLKLFD